MGNGKITKELKGLGTKINDKEPNGETVSEVIKGIAEDYNGDQDTKYTAGNGIAITEENVINADVKVIETSNITGLTTEQCNSLNAGDVVVKLTSNQKHTYTVSYKEAGVGMCLTYVDASVSETVSYDCVEGNWVYNSTDITHLSETPHLYQHLITINGEDTNGDDYYIRIFIYNTSATQLTLNALLGIKINGVKVGSDYNSFAIEEINVVGTESLEVYSVYDNEQVGYEFLLENITFNDTVSQIF